MNFAISAFFDTLHFRTKLTVLITAVSAVAIGMLCIGIILFDISSFRQDLSAQQRSLLKIVNSNIAAAIVFEDSVAIKENLDFYRYQPDIIAVSVTNASKTEVAAFTSSSHSHIPAMPAVLNTVAGDQTFEGGLYLQEPVTFDGEIIGYSRALVSLDALNAKVWFYVRLGLIAVTLTLIVAFAIARRFARVFSAPIEHLVETAKEISKSSDYSMRAQPSSNDEVGDLTRYFNEMLGEIDLRDKGLLEQKHSLEQLVERKTHEIRVALEESEASSQAKSEFLANMSHELRTPLNAVLGFSEVMKMEIFGTHSNAKYKDYAALIHESGTHLLDIINDLLDLAKVEAGKTELMIEASDITRITNEVMEMMGVWAQRKNQDLSFEVHDEIPAVHCDRRMIKQVLVNLISNAIKFTPEGGTVKVTLEKPPTDFVRIIIADTGIGMTTEEIEVAMQPFGQAQSILSRSHEGTGLGLPLVEQFLDMHKAKMRIQSMPGKGTEISVMLPVQT